MTSDTLSIWGSSPHARGALEGLHVHLDLRRDHPRMRGEHGRGLEHGNINLGIIPACAGSTLSPGLRIVTR